MRIGAYPKPKSSLGTVLLESVQPDNLPRGNNLFGVYNGEGNPKASLLTIVINNPTPYLRYNRERLMDK